MRPRRSRARGVGLLFITLMLGVALSFVSGRGRSAPLDAEVAPTKVRPAAKRAKEAEPASSASASAAPSGSAASPPSPAPSASAPPSEAELKTMPRGRRLPNTVNAAVHFLEVNSFDDTKQEYEATVDLRLRWRDRRLKYPASETLHGYKEYRGKEAEEQLGKIWTAEIDVTNRLEGSTIDGRRLRMFPDGNVETITRTTGRYKVHVDPERFPFDRQHLVLDLLVREQTTDEVVLRFDKVDVAFSCINADAEIAGWRPGLVDLKASIVPGWNGDRYSRVVASLAVDRLATSSLAPIFIPLVASLIIPLLAIWMNKATHDGFEIEAFELANMGIGGLFSVIALSFAIYSAYGVIAGSDNTVTRLFALNYVSLAFALGIVVFFFRYNVLLRLFGPYVQIRAFEFIAWAMPLVSVVTSIAFLLVAAA